MQTTAGVSADTSDEPGKQLQHLVRPNIQALTPYRCARDDYSNGVLLDANENSYGPSLDLDKVKELFDPSGLELNRYPDPYQTDVKDLLCKLRGVRPEQIFVGVGSDEAIDLLMRVFCKPGEGGDSILITPPTYGMYKVCAKVNDVAIQTVPLTSDFDVVVEDVLAAVTSSTKLLFFCSPGNPTGKCIPLDTIRAIFDGGYPGILVCDEAYIDFAEQPSACTLIDELPRLVVLQTLSKAFGMAAIRMGMAMANKDIVQYMNNVKAPYNVNRLSQALACHALSDLALYKQRLSLILGEKTRLQNSLRELPFVKRVLESDSNFFLFELEHAHAVYKHMAEAGVVVRYRGSELHCKDCLRTTVGTPEENDRMVELLKETVGKIERGELAKSVD